MGTIIYLLSACFVFAMLYVEAKYVAIGWITLYLFVLKVAILLLADELRRFLKSYEEPYASMEAYQKEGRIINAETGVVTGQIIPSYGASGGFNLSFLFFTRTILINLLFLAFHLL